MASAHVTVKIDAKNIDRVRLLIWEITALRDEMRVAASPFAERIEAICARYAGEQDEDRLEEED